MKKWKIAFGICLTMLLLVTGFSIYYIVDQGVTLTYIREGYKDTENDLNNLSRIINETDLSKTEIKKVLAKHQLFETMDFDKDTVSLDRVMLIFKDAKCIKIINQW
jgi:hypothetical protein